MRLVQQGAAEKAQQAEDDRQQQKEESVMEQELWLAREKGGEGDYGIFVGKPNPCDMDYILDRMSAERIRSGEKGLVEYFCAEIFHIIIPKTTRLRKGRKRKIKRILIELED